MIPLHHGILSRGGMGVRRSTAFNCTLHRMILVVVVGTLGLWVRRLGRGHSVINQGPRILSRTLAISPHGSLGSRAVRPIVGLSRAIHLTWGNHIGWVHRPRWSRLLRRLGLGWWLLLWPLLLL